MIYEDRIRWYQAGLYEYLTGGGKRAIAIWHRRAGKDEVAMKAARTMILDGRIGTYWHCLPEYAQARKAIWDAVNPHTGRRRIDEAFPPEMRENVRDDQMFMRFANGATWQLIGSDRYDATVGAGPVSITYSEWALSNPQAWAYHRPMLVENNGTACFITTPRGRNHAFALYERWKGLPDHFAEILSARDTKALTEAQLQEALDEYCDLFGQDVGTAQFEQEYLCSFNAAILGAYFGREMAKADAEGRIRSVPVDPGYPVHTAWDLGKAVNNPIWCFQVIGGVPHVVDFYRPDSDDLEQWVHWLDERGYKGTDYVPHDAAVSDWGAKRTRVETLRLLGRRPMKLPMVSVEDGRHAARRTINAAVFDAERCELGLEGLRQYRREWDAELKTYRDNPVKDWSEHIGSAFRYLGLAWREMRQDAVAARPPTKPTIHADEDGRIRSTIPLRDLMLKQGKKRRWT